MAGAPPAPTNMSAPIGSAPYHSRCLRRPTVHERLLQAPLDCHRRFFAAWYTVRALTDVDLPPARDEPRRAAPILQQYVKKPPRPNDPYALRRHGITQPALELI